MPDLCDLPLFNSNASSTPGTAGPAFSSPSIRNHIHSIETNTLGMRRIESAVSAL